MSRLARNILEAGCHAYELRNYKKSMRLFLSSAKMGNVEAQVNLANMLDDGVGIRAGDFERARYWYRRAIRKGSAEAAYNLAVSYRNRGFYRWAVFWFKKAHEMGDADAFEEIGK